MPHVQSLMNIIRDVEDVLTWFIYYPEFFIDYENGFIII